MTCIESFLEEIRKINSRVKLKEKPFRRALAQLFETFGSGITVDDESEFLECGIPDLAIKRGFKTIGYLEQKRIGLDIRNLNEDNKRQQIQYKKALPNLIYTNCTDWDFYRNGERVESVKIADSSNNEIRALTNNFSKLEENLKAFLNFHPEPISDPRKLAVHLAQNSILIRNIINQTIDEKSNFRNKLERFQSFVEINLIEGITREEFVDMLIEALVFSMLVSYWYGYKPANQSSVENLVPRRFYLLRGFQLFLKESDFFEHIKWVIEKLVDIFSNCDLKIIMEGTNHSNHAIDPFIEFYETFMDFFNKDKRKNRGVWYTPYPVVDFIVRAVDQVLTREFGISKGLASVQKVEYYSKGKSRKAHKVQILDPAAGTGTFLESAIELIADKLHTGSFSSTYVKENLLPRIHGFEILMAPYVLCQLRLAILADRLGIVSRRDLPKFSIQLSNSINTTPVEDEQSDFQQINKWLIENSTKAIEIKKELPIMCVIGNPPYRVDDDVASGILGQLMQDYRFQQEDEPKLKNVNSKAINNLYVKFIRTASNLIEENGEGVIGFVTDHGYLENLAFRGMRKHMLNTFDKIWILDLHGNTNRKEIDPDGKADSNVFEIMTGVAILIAAKFKRSKGEFAEIKLFDSLKGSREMKNRFLENKSVYGREFKKISPRSPDYYFENLDYRLYDRYKAGFCLNEVFMDSETGITTGNDKILVDFEKNELKNRILNIKELDKIKIKKIYNLNDEKIDNIQADLNDYNEDNFVQMCYRPFENRWIYYTRTSDGVLNRPRPNVMPHMLGKKQNIVALLSSRQQGEIGFQHAFVSNIVANDCVISNISKEANKVFPLYTYKNSKKEHNFSDKFINDINSIFMHKMPNEYDIFDYIYGVLHCENYRKTYASFLRKNYPRIPWPKNSRVFWRISRAGSELRRLHLLDEKEIGESRFEFSNGKKVVKRVCVERIEFRDRSIWVNEFVFVRGVPDYVWNFKIGGYNPAKLWLENRRGKSLNANQTRHYCNILEVLIRTRRIMDSIEVPLED